MTVSTSTTPLASSSRARRGLSYAGVLGVTAGLVGVAHSLLVAAYSPAVPEGSYSYPFPAGGFVASQAFLTARDLALAALIAGLLRTPAARGRIAPVALMSGAVSMLALAGLEIVSAAIGDSADLGAWYGLASFGVGLGLTVAGVVAARTPVSSAWLRFLPLAIGLYVFAVLTPGILAGFTSGQLVIGGWMLLFACLGRALLQPPASPPPAPAPCQGTQRWG